MARLDRRLAWTVCAGVLLAVAVFVLRRDAPGPDPGEPADERTYREWVRSINQGASEALLGGIDLLHAKPHLTRLYTRLAILCLELDRAEECRAAFNEIKTSDELSALHKEAALARFAGDEREEIEAWQRVAASTLLNPGLARQAVDRMRQTGGLDVVENVWTDVLAADSSRSGATFGLAYAAALRNEWGRARTLLERATRLAPDDPEAYAELGRLHFLSGGYEAFASAMDAAIDRARRNHDAEREIVLRGNFGLGLLQFQGDLEQADTMFETALVQATSLAMAETRALNLYRLANVRGRQHRYDEALTLLDSADVLYTRHLTARRPELLTTRGMILLRTFRFAEAEHVLETALRLALEHGNTIGSSGARIALSQARYQMGMYGAAYADALEALDVTSRHELSDLGMAARVVLGEIERLRGNYKKAEEHFSAALATAEETQNVARGIEMQRQLGITAVQIGDLVAAGRHFENVVAATADGQPPRARADASLWVGTTYLFHENLERAILAFDEAIAELEGTGDPLLGVVLARKAAALHYQGAYDESVALLEEALSHVSEAAMERHTIETAIGHAFVRQGEFETAITHFERADALEVDLQWSAVQWYVLYGRALAYWGLNDVDRAEAAFRNAVSVIDALRESLLNPEDRSLFVHDKIDVYNDFSSFLESHGRTAEAFHVSERARSRTLVDLLYTMREAGGLDLDRPADRAVELNRQIRALDREAADLHLTADGSGDGGYREHRAAVLRRERFRSDSLYRQLELELFAARTLYAYEPVVVDSVYNMLEPGEAVVMYDLRKDVGRDEGSGSVVYVVSKSGIESLPLPIDAHELTETIRFFRDVIGQSVNDERMDWRAASSRLYAFLIQPVRPRLPDHVTHLHVVPDGPLHYLPFAALMDDDGRFLVEEFTLSVAPSVSVLKLARERNPQRWQSMLLIADPEGRLPGARREALSIVADAPGSRRALVGREATQDAFERMAATHDVIHFATHGSFSSRAPWDSHLELHGDVLTVDAIGRFPLDAYLVTLSACETALASGMQADIPRGDEWVGLNQAFLAAGTPTVMASLWPIDDRVSSDLMVSFYRNLGTDGKAAALALVQRSFIDDPERRHPFYWAAFSVIGDPL